MHFYKYFLKPLIWYNFSENQFLRITKVILYNFSKNQVMSFNCLLHTLVSTSKELIAAVDYCKKVAFHLPKKLSTTLVEQTALNRLIDPAIQHHTGLTHKQVFQHHYSSFLWKKNGFLGKPTKSLPLDWFKTNEDVRIENYPKIFPTEIANQSAAEAILFMAYQDCQPKIT